MSLIPNNPLDVVESLIWNTLIPSQPELANGIDNSDDNDDLSPMLVESDETDRTCCFKPFNFLEQHDIQSQPRAIHLNIFCFVEWISLWFRMNMHVTHLFN